MDKKILRIVYSENFKPKNYKFSLINYIKACLVFYKTRNIMKRGIPLDALKYIESLSKQKKIEFDDLENEIYNARRIINIINHFDIKHKRILCLEYSICLCAALVYLGFEIDLFIGKSLNYVGKYNFHSWLEISGVTVNFRTNYSEVFNIVYHKSF